MSTGVYVKTAGDIIRDALRAANISGISVPIEDEDFEQGRIALNDILAWLQTQQIHLWSQTEAFLPLVKNKKKYSFPGDRAYEYHICTRTTAAHNGPSVFDLNSGVLLEIAPDTVLVFDDGRIRLKTIDGVQVGDVSGIELPNGDMWWSTITQVGEDWVQVADDFPSFLDENAIVYIARNQIDIPVRVLDARYSWRCGEDVTPMRQEARKDYFDQPTKGTIGNANTWYYDRQLSAGHLYLWPVAQKYTEVVTFTYIKPQYIPEDQAEQIQVPPEWYLPLKNKLAAELGIMYAIDPNKQAILEAKAANYVEDALGTDDEFSSFSFYPDRY